MRQTHPWRTARGAFTLVELLVVIAILVILLAVTIPTMRTSVKGREIREAARQINVIFSRAKSLALVRGRPVGVWIERLTGTPSASLQLFIAETPPSYSGDTEMARAVMLGQPGVAILEGSAMANVLRIGRGDFIKFDYKGPVYEITEFFPGGDGRFRFAHPTALPPPSFIKLPYQIFRRPRKSSTAPLQLPGSVVVDLENSGFGAKGYDFHPNHPLLPPLDQNNVWEIVITFSPGGKVGYVYYGGDALGQNVLRVRPIGSVHLLVGHIDQLASANPPNPSELNLADASNLWVSIAGQSGRITTSENRGLDQVDLVNVDPTVPIPPLLHGQLLWRARTFAVQSQSMGGR